MAVSMRHESGWVFYYDGDCGFCAGAGRWLSKADFFHSVEWIPWQSLAEPPNGLSGEDLGRAAYLDAGNGRLYKGFHAFRMLALRLPPLLPIAPMLWLPGMDALGRAAYGWIAQNRYRFSGCSIERGGRA
jgi:predicted DCC family thiol-disulfide oxidoreductase YuxK